MREVIAVLLGHHTDAPGQPTSDLARTEPHHKHVMRKADRVIEEYRKLDGVLVLYVRRR